MSCRGLSFGWPWARPPATLRSVEASKGVGGRGSDYARAGRGGRGGAAARRRLIVFRAGLYAGLRRRADALFELADAVLTRAGPAGSLVELSGEKAFRRGHGALYDALGCGDIDQEVLGDLL